MWKFKLIFLICNFSKSCLVEIPYFQISDIQIFSLWGVTFLLIAQEYSEKGYGSVSSFHTRKFWFCNSIIFITIMASCCHNCWQHTLPRWVETTANQEPSRCPRRAFPLSVPGVTSLLLLYRSQISGFGASPWSSGLCQRVQNLLCEDFESLFSFLPINQVSKCCLSRPSTPRPREPNPPTVGSNMLSKFKQSKE